MKPVLLIGGPYDGRMTDVTDDLPVFWRILDALANKPLVRAAPRLADRLPDECPVVHHTYMRQAISWGVESQVEVYTYSGVDR